MSLLTDFRDLPAGKTNKNEADKKSIDFDVSLIFMQIPGTLLWEYRGRSFS